ncbi:LOW QUALITY PROTEIN: interleukin-1 receptor accessory protein-like [Takifugu flavidus]|uniref:LOW QUALITY PROTEIN: interleukin-1 receptor accessory protein-like n=1 Tax=Takifugu flavidus TaxID=433684 RepID=UPI00254480A4|nr:LOW QUALITY PROTEIN: interleukin-1 receptor accessory protein-like [Takifugu flavidus]
MAALISVLVLLLDPTQSEPTCRVQSQSGAEPVPVVSGEVGWLSCPLFPPPSIFNDSSHSLSWSRLPEGGLQEQPITFSRSLVRDQQRLVLLEASLADAGGYTCRLGNRSVCIKATMQLTVLRPDQVVRSTDCEPAVATATRHVVIPFQDERVLECPDLQEASRLAPEEPSVTWMFVKPGKRCESDLFWKDSWQQRGNNMEIHIMNQFYQGLYYCTVRFQRGGRTLRFTRRLNVTAVSQRSAPKPPSILRLSHDPAFPVRTNSEVRLVCRALLPYLNSSGSMWWTVDGTRLENHPDLYRFTSTNRLVLDDFGDRTEESVLVIQNLRSEDVQREFNCSVENLRGWRTKRAELHLEVSPPLVPLGCGLGVTLLLLILLFVIYHVFWLELRLIYRSWFGTEERDSGRKDFDVYISYTRNSEDESFVLSTLRCVLENHFGYSVCIFDRDSLPGGTVNDDTLTFVARSRRLLVVLGPGYGCRGSQALLELKAGIDNMALGGHLRVILVQYRCLERQGWVKELRRARVALTLVRWQGEKSKELTSRFWKQLRVELPVHTLSRREAVLMRLHSENSTSSQRGLLSNTVELPETGAA